MTPWRGLAAANTPGLRTWMSNLVVDPSPEGATGRAYIMTADLTAVAGGSGTGRRWTEAVQSRDAVVRTPEGWRFKTRTYNTRIAGDLERVGPD